MKNLKFIPTKKLSEILSHPYTQGINGADYEPVREELQKHLWDRNEKLIIAMQEMYDQDQKAYDFFLDSIGVPQVTKEIFDETFYRGVVA